MSAPALVYTARRGSFALLLGLKLSFILNIAHVAFDSSMSNVLEGWPHCGRILPILFQRLPAVLRADVGL
jgi:hypothetical protein